MYQVLCRIRGSSEIRPLKDKNRTIVTSHITSHRASCKAAKTILSDSKVILSGSKVSRERFTGLSRTVEDMVSCLTVLPNSTQLRRGYYQKVDWGATTQIAKMIKGKSAFLMSLVRTTHSLSYVCRTDLLCSLLHLITFD